MLPGCRDRQTNHEWEPGTSSGAVIEGRQAHEAVRTQPAYEEVITRDRQTLSNSIHDV